MITLPLPSAFMVPRKALVSRKGARRLTSSVLSQSSTVISSRVFQGLVAALFTRTSSLPNLSRTSSLSLLISSTRAKSVIVVVTLPPLALTETSRSSSSEAVREAATT